MRKPRHAFGMMLWRQAIDPNFRSRFGQRTDLIDDGKRARQFGHRPRREAPDARMEARRALHQISACRAALRRRVAICRARTRKESRICSGVTRPSSGLAPAAVSVLAGWGSSAGDNLSSDRPNAWVLSMKSFLHRGRRQDFPLLLPSAPGAPGEAS